MNLVVLPCGAELGKTTFDVILDHFISNQLMAKHEWKSGHFESIVSKCRAISYLRIFSYLVWIRVRNEYMKIPKIN